MIPPFTSDELLPPGVHEATWDEVVERFAFTSHRALLLEGLQRLTTDLAKAGCRRVYLDGSFVTAKEAPGDFDLCWETEGVDPDALPIILRNPVKFHGDIRHAYGGDAYATELRPGFGGWTFFEFFQFDLRTMKMKGLVLIRLEPSR